MFLNKKFMKAKLINTKKNCNDVFLNSAKKFINFHFISGR